MSAQALDVTLTAGVLDITSDVQVYASDFTSNITNASAFGAENVEGQTPGTVHQTTDAGTLRPDTFETATATDLSSSTIGELTVGNLTPPSYGEGENSEITIVIERTAGPDMTSTDGGSDNTGKITVGFDVDWIVSGNTYTISSDDSTLDVTYIPANSSNTSISLSLSNQTVNDYDIINDTIYGGDGEISLDAVQLIQKLEAATTADGGSHSFSGLSSRFATAGTTLEVSVDVSNLPIYYLANEQITSITSTIDIVDVIA
jgi:hypothetical protein